MAQPGGFPDEIVVRFGGSPDAHVAAVLAGSADLAEDCPRGVAGRAGALQTQHASQLELNPGGVTHLLVLNTRVPPFDDVRVRRALNFAIDRERLRDITVGRGLGELTARSCLRASTATGGTAPTRRAERERSLARPTWRGRGGSYAPRALPARPSRSGCPSG